MTAQAQSIQLVALNKLVASPRNVRKQDRKADLDALATSIAAHGLLQNLCVVPTEGGKFEVDAGGRRLAALKQLAKQGVLSKDHPVPCHVEAAERGIEVSLTENVHRVAMDAMDEVDAYAALVADGKTPDDVARRFGVERRYVDQRLALAGLSPRIKAAWKRGDVSLEAARAFCLVDDHAQQDAVFRSLGKPVTHGSSVRARLMDGRMRATDRLATFVGLGDVRIHDLRHTFASVGASGGIGLPLIGGILGHRQASTTQRYAHLSDTPLRRAADEIGRQIAARLSASTSTGSSAGRAREKAEL